MSRTPSVGRDLENEVAREGDAERFEVVARELVRREFMVGRSRQHEESVERLLA